MAWRCWGVHGLQRKGVQDTSTQRVDQKLESRKEVKTEDGRDDSSQNEGEAIVAKTEMDSACHWRCCSDGLTASDAERRAMNEVG